MSPLRRPVAPRSGRSVIAVVAAITVVVTIVGSSGSAATEEPAGAADRAARWLASQVADGTITTGGVADPGLAADVALALTATGRQDGAAAALTRELLARPAAYVSPAGPGQVVAGAAAKLALLAEARGVDPTDAGGVDLLAELSRTLVDAPGTPDDGRFRDRAPVAVPTLADRSNAFSQALGVLALARRGAAPRPAVDHLLDQQCPGGAFRLFLTGGRGCTTDAAADVDATALAVVALRAVPAGATPAVAPASERALDALERVQATDGSFASSGPGATANANSTGLAAHALRAGGRTVAADRAAAWLRGLQVGCTPVATDDGAIAFSPAARTAAAAGIPRAGRDQFRRATSQAILAFDAAPLGTAGAVVPTVADCPTTPGGTSTVPTIPTSSTTTTVPPDAPASTTAPPPIPTTGPPPTGDAAAVLGATASADDGATAGTGAGGGATGRSLAYTGAAPGLPAAVAIWVLVGGFLLVVATRGRRP